tara:strand:+ start:138 stop:521 length:384 start_codon:yes stop_codon:yes gene_type:complete
MDFKQIKLIEKKMNTQENNKLIAEFMGMIRHDQDEGCMIQMTHQGNKVVLVSSMKYHSSWDWLMSVVDKIFSLGYDYEIKPRYMVIKERLSSEVLVSKCFVYDKSQKEIIYDAVVEFINEYNKHKNT